MRAFLFMVLFFLGAQSWAKNVDFKLEAVPLPKAVSVIYDEVLNKPYMKARYRQAVISWFIMVKQKILHG